MFYVSDEKSNLLGLQSVPKLVSSTVYPVGAGYFSSHVGGGGGGGRGPTLTILKKLPVRFNINSTFNVGIKPLSFFRFKTFLCKLQI